MAWILDVILIALVSKVTLLRWLSKFVQCWVPRESVLWGLGADKATSTAQNLKVTLIEWHLKLLALHQVFMPNVIILMMKGNWKFQFLSTSLLVASLYYCFLYIRVPLPLGAPYRQSDTIWMRIRAFFSFFKKKFKKRWKKRIMSSKLILVLQGVGTGWHRKKEGKIKT